VYVVIVSMGDLYTSYLLIESDGHLLWMLASTSNLVFLCQNVHCRIIWGGLVMGTGGIDIRTRGVCMHDTVSLGPMNVRVTEQHLKAYDSHAITSFDADSTKNLELSIKPIV
jgi:hypothetical protein